MRRMERKEKHGIKLNAAQRKGLLVALARKWDWKARRAREDFRRPAFQGTVLEPGCEKSNNK